MALPDKIAQIDQLKAELDALMPMSPEKEKKLWEKMRLDWNFNSNHIEGNTLTYGETQLLLMFDKTTGDHEKREYDEMQAHDAAIHLIKVWAADKQRDLTETDIRELNKIILVKPFWKAAITADGQSTKRLIKIGAYKEFPNSVRLKNGEMFEYTSPMDTPQKMGELIEMYQKSTVPQAIINASQLHYSFVRIHPFDDGNGRVARLLVNYVLLKNGYPPLIVKSNDKENYLTALNKADAGDLTAFHEYMAEQLIKSLKLTIKAAKGEEIAEPDDFEKEIKQIELALKNSKNEVLRKTPELLWKVWENSISPLYNALYNKLNKLSTFFTDFEIEVSPENRILPGTKEQQDNILHRTFSNNPPNQLRIRYIFRGFKGGDAKALFDLNVYVEMRFNDYDYEVDAELNSTDKQTPTKKLYSEQLTPDEISKIIDVKAKHVLQEIKSNYKRLTGKEL